jgi:hypothetical protein
VSSHMKKAIEFHSRPASMAVGVRGLHSLSP